jgi:hypothetical protein
MSVIDCRSEEGITIGLIDTILTAAHLLVDRDLDTPAVQEALDDFASSKELMLIKDAAKNPPRLPDEVVQKILDNFDAGQVYKMPPGALRHMAESRIRINGRIRCRK